MGALSSLPASAATLPVSFRLAPAADAVALQFDVTSSVAGTTLATPVLQGIGGHVVDSQSLPGAVTRFLVYSTANSPVASAETIGVTLNVEAAAVQDGILSVSNVVATNGSGTQVAATPGAIPQILGVSPPGLATAATGRPLPVGVEVVDLDGTVVGVSFSLNGSPTGTDGTRPFSQAITSASGIL